MKINISKKHLLIKTSFYIFILIILIGIIPVTRTDTTPILFTKISEISTPGAFDVNVQNKLVYVSCGYSGLKIFDVNDPYNIKVKSTLSQSGQGYAHYIIMRDNLAYIGNGKGGLWIVNCSNPNNPTTVATFTGGLQIYPWDVKLNGDLAYITSGFMGGNNPGLFTLNISNPEDISIVDYLPTEDVVVRLEIVENTLFILTLEPSLTLVNASIPDELDIISSFNDVDGLTGYPTDIVIEKDHAFLVSYEGDTSILNISDYSNIQIITNNFVSSDKMISILVNDTYAFLAAEEDGLYCIDITNISNPEILNKYTEINKPYRMFIEGNFLYVIDDDIALIILELKKDTGQTSFAVLFMGFSFVILIIWLNKKR